MKIIIYNEKRKKFDNKKNNYPFNLKMYVISTAYNIQKF